MFVITAYRWYARNPVVTVIESTQGAIWDVPFPAVTVCDINVISKRAARSLSNNLTLPLHITPDYVFKALKLVPLLFLGTNVKQKDKEKLKILQDIIDTNGITIKTLFTTLSPTFSCDNLIQRCMWKNIVYRCDHLFQQVTIKIGICCSFNYFAVNDSDSLNPDLLRLSTPRRVASCGYQTALTVLLKVDVDDYYSSGIATQGILVFIDNAYNIPDQDSPARMVSPSSEVLIALAPERTYSTSGIKAFTPEQRQCYFHNEVTISNFKQYSFHNCMVFQRILTIKTECGCVPWFFPEKDGYRVCNFRDIDCMETLPERVTIEDIVNLPDSVPCLPECEHYDYPLEVAMGKLSGKVPLNGLPFFENVNIENSSVLNIFFNDLVSTRYRRDVYLNWQNILAAFGGLLSLMLGFTFISGIDFVIFFMFRIVYDCTFSNIWEEKEWTPDNKIIQVEEKKKSKFSSKRVWKTRY
ncbi:sodium channel protein Nach [Pieris rapae]|uniref:sodium channel protein Nach n=1 Tax=Pieris rapae TaxID=64459 RepID=UPI001E28134E|nr:sodium channel protein Nach [Pieris rapae]